MQSFKNILRKKKEFLSLFTFLLLLLTLPFFAYFVADEESFDKRSEAAIFNALVDEKEVEIEANPFHVPGSIRLEFPEHVTSEEIEEIIGRPRSTPPELMDTHFERVEYIEVEPSEMAREMARYERYSSAESVDLNTLSFTSGWREDGSNRALPNDWHRANHWYFNQIKLPEAWRIQGCLEGDNECGGSKDIVVAVIDTGLAFNAPEAQGMNIWSHSSYNRNSHRDVLGHGTYVAGLIASATNNNASSVGMGHNLTIMPLNASDNLHGMYPADRLERAINYAAKHADVINMSLGGCAPISIYPWRNSLTYAVRDRGVVVVAASGNAHPHPQHPCHPSRWGFKVGAPASHPDVIAVGAVDSNNRRSVYSHYGSGLDFVAPVGSGPLSAGTATWQQTLRPNTTTSFSNQYHIGTSASSPQVAGAAGLILSLDPTLSPREVKDVLKETATPLSNKNETGYGLLNLENIYEYFEPKGPEGSCGSLDGMIFPPETEEWPSNDFCSVGEAEPSSPAFPSVEEEVFWKCVSSSGEESCSAKRASLQCQEDSDCRREPPYEVCFHNMCMLGDVEGDGAVGPRDFVAFKEDFLKFKTEGWSDELKRSDFLDDERVSMADYSVFVWAYRLFNEI